MFSYSLIFFFARSFLRSRSFIHHVPCIHRILGVYLVAVQKPIDHVVDIHFVSFHFGYPLQSDVKFLMLAF